MKKNKWLSLVLVLALVFSLCTTALAAAPEQAASDNPLPSRIEKPQTDLIKAKLADQHKPGDQVRVIILTKSRPTVENRGLISKFLNTDAKLMREHNEVKQQMERQEIGFKVNFEYTALLNGMSVTIKYADLDKIAALPGVDDVVLCREYRIPVTQPKATTASEMIAATAMGGIGADGSGKVIAVLDTGITVGHEAFQVYKGMLLTPSLDYASMKTQLKLLGHGKYVSQKIPFQYDYADGDNDATDDNSGHGSHVAGIAAGYVASDEGEVLFRGSAPDAQILAMKIFSSESSTTSSDIYFAALEDALKLGADVINMSIGAPSGFVEDSESVLNDRIYERLENAGVIVCASAGNEATLGEYSSNILNQYYGTSYIMGSNADYGLLGSPASYTGNVAVAAVENLQYPTYMIAVGEDSFAYLDSNGTALLDQFAGQDLAYVMVPNLGAAEDYEGLDVQGKVAVISRGEITFEEKVSFAAEAGAIAAVIYDNSEGALVSMAIETHSIPSVFVSQEAGAALEALEAKTFHVNEEQSIVANPEAYNMASFSSWGPTNDLQIKPSITGVGGNVYSVSHGTENGYEVMSGTSMSAPNVSGGYATLLEALSEAYPNMSKAELAELARNRTLSSAYVLPAYAEENDDGGYTVTPYSPRQQGAGLMDLASAYLSTLAITDPLAELGDSEDGVFTITAEVQNTADVERTYAISADVLTDSLYSDNFGSDDEPDYRFYNLLEASLLAEGEDYTLDGPESITLAPGETKTVTLTITLTEETRAYYLDYFENGAFIDGYVYFNGVEDETGAADHQHVTFLGFYGDWEAQPILSSYDWRDDLSGITAENDTIPTEAYLIDENYDAYLYAGDSPFDYPEDYEYSDARIAVSPNTDATFLNAMLVVPTIERNARHIIMIAHDGDQIFNVDDTPYCSKTYYDAGNGQWATYAWFLFDGYDYYSGEEPTLIPDDTQVTLDFYANLPIGEDALGAMTPEEILANGAEYLQYTMPCVVDGAEPEFENIEYDPESGDLSFDVKDNQYLAAAYVVDAEGNDLVDPVLFADTEPGQSHTVTVNVGEQEAFYLAAMDFATNEGNVVVMPAPVIVKQPESVTANADETVQFTVEATGAELTYQWQFKAPGTSTWYDSGMEGADTDTLSVPATAARDGQQYRCVVTNAAGSVTSEPATLTVLSMPVITLQPKPVSTKPGETVTFTVKAIGTPELTYQWQFKAPGTSKWYDSGMTGAKTAKLTVPATAARNGQQYRCVVTNDLGSVTSDPAKMTVLSVPVITTQPENVVVAYGDMVKFTVKATGGSLSYQWQYKAPGSSVWKDSGLSGAKTAVLKVTAEKARNGQQYRCIVTNALGSATSEPAKLTVAEQAKPLIMTQPKSQTAKVGATVNFTVQATGGDLSYQWQFKASGTDTWYKSNMTGSNTATLQVPVTAARDGQQYRCIVTNRLGTVTSDPAKLTVLK